MSVSELINLLSPLFIIGGAVLTGARLLWGGFKREMDYSKQAAENGIALLAGKLDEQNKVYISSRQADSMRFSAIELQQARTDAKTDVLITVFAAGAHNTTQTRIDLSNGGDNKLA